MASPIIKVRTISAATETAIQFSNGVIARSISIPNGWTQVRVGVRLHMTDSGADLPGTPTFAVGLCAGLTNVLGDATTTHFAGLLTQALSNHGATFYNALTFKPAKKVGTTLTLGTSLTTSVTFGNGAASNSADISPFFVDFFKGSPNYTFRAFANTSATPTQISAADFLTQMQASTPAFTSCVYFAGQTLAVDEGADGVFDSINIYYDPTAAAMEICDIAFCRLA